MSAPDSSGNGNTGTVSKASWIAGGKFGGAFTFNGTSSTITIPSSPKLNTPGALTLEAWVRPKGSVAGTRTLIAKERSGGGFPWGLELNEGVPRAYVDTGAAFEAVGTSALRLKTWTFVAAAYDGSALRLFVNGKQVARTPATGPLATSSWPLSIGADTVWGEYFRGDIDNVRVYPSALDASQITADMTAPVVVASLPTPPPPPSDPVPPATSPPAVQPTGDPAATPPALPTGVPGWCLRVFYVDFAGGSDSNAGSSKSAPWKFAPGMDGFSGSYSHAARDCFVFKGGVTWTLTQAGAPYWTIDRGGASAAQPDWYGVDSSWYAGSSWSRPVLDFAAGGAISNTFLISVGASNVTVSGFDVRNWHWTTDCFCGPFYANTASHTSIVLTDIYCHAWAHTAGSAESACFTGDTGAAYGSNGVVKPGNMIDGVTCDGAPNGTDSGNCVYGSWETVRNSTAKNTCNDFGKMILKYFYGNTAATTNDCTGTAHENNVYISPPGGCTDCAIYDNVIYGNIVEPLYVTLEQVDAGSPLTLKIYNNVMYNIAPGHGGLEVDPEMTSDGTRGTIYFYNNTIEMDNGGEGVRVASRSSSCLSQLIARNNHLISSNSSLVRDESGGCTRVTQDHNVSQTPSAASAQGYAAGSLYAPADGASATVGAGTDGSATVAAVDRRGVRRPAGGSWDAGAYER